MLMSRMSPRTRRLTLGVVLAAGAAALSPAALKAQDLPGIVGQFLGNDNNDRRYDRRDERQWRDERERRRWEAERDARERDRYRTEERRHRTEERRHREEVRRREEEDRRARPGVPRREEPRGNYIGPPR
jgi:hypothetical protein